MSKLTCLVIKDQGYHKVRIFFGRFSQKVIFAAPLGNGDVAQLVEQRTENPCVGGSIPSITTKKKPRNCRAFFLWYAFIL